VDFGQTDIHRETSVTQLVLYMSNAMHSTGQTMIATTETTAYN